MILLRAIIMDEMTIILSVILGILLYLVLPSNVVLIGGPIILIFMLLSDTK